MRSSGWIACLLVLFLACPANAKDPKALGPVETAFDEAHSKAVARATAFLIKQIDADGLPLPGTLRSGRGEESRTLGTAALALYALASADIESQRGAVERGLQHLASQAQGAQDAAEIRGNVRRINLHPRDVHEVHRPRLAF